MAITIDINQLNTTMALIEKHAGTSDAKLLNNLTVTMQDLLHSAITAAKHASAKNPEAQHIQSGGVDLIQFDDNKLAMQMDSKVKNLLQKVGGISEPTARQEIKDAILKITTKASGGAQTTSFRPKTASNDPKLPTSPQTRRGNQ